jgi:pyruvate/2-oxoglutarate dehydrogenase complex dihydrolipoamide dehydrogenase (E3) component
LISFIMLGAAAVQETAAAPQGGADPMSVPLAPLDDHNQQLLANAHPTDWVNPEPKDRYHLVVIGAGTAGLVTAAGAAGLGARVALVERDLMGGDCLNVGCVPSKALIRSARVAAQARNAAGYGVRVPGVQVDFAGVMERMRKLRAGISPNDSAARFRRLGVDVFLGGARFSGPDAVEVAGKTLRFRKAVIATGARARHAAIPGLSAGGFLTNETIFSLTERPPRLAVIGGGPIGCELAQTFARLGSRVTLLQSQPHILPREDADAADLVDAALSRDGVEIILGAEIASVEQGPGGRTLRLRKGHVNEIEVDEILVAVGRQPNVEGLNLEAVGVQYDARLGVQVNDRLQTNNARIYAAGDICTRYQFTHAADALARIVIQNALFWGRARASALTIPWCTYTEPEIAHVGLSEKDAQEKRIAVKVFKQDLHDVDRAVLDGQAEGFVKILVQAGGDRIVGATIVADHAGDLISEITLAMVHGIGLGKIARTIHPYPTQAEAIKKLGDAYNRTRLTPWVKWLLGTWLAWTR